MIDLHPNTPSQKQPALLVVILIVCFAAFAGGVFASHIWQKTNKTEERDEGQYYEVIQEESTSDEVIEEANIEFVAEPGALNIDWFSITQQTIVLPDATFIEARCIGTDGLDTCGIDSPFFIQLGTVRGGDYDEYRLEMITEIRQEFGRNYYYYYVLRKDGEAPVILDKHFNNTVDWLPTGVARGDIMTYTASSALGDLISRLHGYIIETEAFIPELLDSEETITDVQGRTYLFTGAWVRLYSDEAISLVTARYSTELVNGQTLYLYEPIQGDDGVLLGGQTGIGRDQFYLVDEDGRVMFYDLAVPFFDYEIDGDGYVLISQGAPNIVWNDGSKNTQKYTKGALGGCGFTTATSIISSDTQKELNLVSVGKAIVDGKEYANVYEPESYDIDYYTDAFNAVTFSFHEGEQKQYSDFDHPYVYFQDSFGRWIQLTNYELMPPVECGKPVIYLYPEEQTDIDVWVNPRGGFSYTEPDYGNGWKVTAYPDGALINHVDGKEYPYLFWEGRGGLYPEVQNYWVIEKSKVNGFLNEKLSQMNLNEQEIADFLEFWLPRMQHVDYYKIGFHGTSIMNELAPLSLSVPPDHIFRILMDYQELDAWQPSNPPKNVPKANREGFEVIEWGGVLR